MDLNVCVVGYGLMGKTHAEMYAGDKRVKRVTVIDPFIDPKSVRTPKVTFEERVPEKTNYDIVSICSPTFTHYDVYKILSDRSGAFLVEKPPTVSLEESLKIKRSAQRRRQIIGCAFVERFNPLIRRLFEDKKFSDRNAYYVFERIFPIPNQQWYQDYNQSGGPLLDLGIHDFDLLNWIVGRKPEIVEARENSGIFTSELDFGKGLSARVVSGWSRDGEIKNSISFNDVELDGRSLDQERYPKAYRNEINSFVNYVLGITNDYPLISEGIAALEIALRIKKELTVC